jgi:predicted permease
MAFCLVLLVMAGLLVRALTAAAHISPGIDVDAIDVASIDLSLAGAPPDQRHARAEEIRERFAVLPGARHAALASVVPLEGTSMGRGALRHPGATDPAEAIRADWNVVSPEFFEALRLPIVGGRTFTRADRQDAPLVAIVNEQFANVAWPGENPVGRRIENGDFRPGRESSLRTLTVVGVARDVKHRWIGEVPGPFIFVPIAQHDVSDVHVLLRRAEGTATATLQPAVRQALASLDRDLPLVRYLPLRQYADLGLLPQRIAASLAGCLGVVALFLVAIGLYGMMAMAVASRQREFGVRLALGADSARLIRSVLVRAARVSALGGLVGFVLALGAAQLLTDMLFGVPPLDPVALGGAVLMLAVVTLAASWGPARRAAKTDPMVTLRGD